MNPEWLIFFTESTICAWWSNS